MGVRTVVRLMIDGTQVEISLQLPVGALDATDDVIVISAGAFIESLHVGAEVIYADVRVHVILCLDLHAVLLVEQIVGDVAKAPFLFAFQAVNYHIYIIDILKQQKILL